MLLFPLFFATGALADDVTVLPKGVSNVSLGNFFYPFPTTERFNKRGEPEEIAAVFNNRRLDSTVFPTLLPPGQNIGTAFVKFKYDFNILDFGAQPLAVASAGPAVPQTGDAILDFTFRYDWNLPTDVTIRISDPSNPITTNRERVNRKFGDKFEFESSGKYYLLQGLSFTGLYRIGFKVGAPSGGTWDSPPRLLRKTPPRASSSISSA